MLKPKMDKKVVVKIRGKYVKEVDKFVYLRSVMQKSSKSIKRIKKTIESLKNVII
jgi:hypothetical protein